MLRHRAFDDEAAAFRIKPNCQPVERHFPDGTAHAWKVVRVVRDLVVGDEERAVVFVLQLDPVFERARIVPEVQRTCRPDRGENALLRHYALPPGGT